jgi:phospholipid/cholesterol/gamma-HCH transport system substrate-binding protein
LGETFVELRPGPAENETIAKNEPIPYEGVVGDFNLLMTQFNEIGADIKEVTSALKTMVGPDDSSPVYRTVHNLDQFAEMMKDVTLRNEKGLNQIVENLAVLTGELRGIVERRQYDIDQTLAGLSNITRKVDEGRGTVGRLINDDSTVNKLNEAVDNLNDALGGLRKLETDIGYHTEYLGGTKDFKHYVHLDLKPTPDEAFLLEFVSDPSPSPTRVTKDTTITAGGTKSTINTDTETIDRNRFLFSAQLAKQLYDFTLRGGIIESSGGVGLDYNKGPVGLKLSAFDFDTDKGARPHLKATGSLNLTKSLYLIGGADDIIHPAQPVDWFVGAGFQLTDENVKSLLGIGSRAVR